jgi:hypothetical protein
MTYYNAKLKISAKTLLIHLSHIQLTLTILPWKQNLLALGRPLLVTEYKQQ